MQISLKQSYYIYKAFLAIIFAAIWVTFFSWCSYTYDRYLELNIMRYIKNLTLVEKESEFLIAMVKAWAIHSAYICVIIVVLRGIRLFVKKLSVPYSFIGFWDGRGEVSSILGRMLAGHFRNNTILTFEDFFWFYKRSSNQGRNLAYYRSDNREEILAILSKYDPYFVNDVKSDQS